MNKCKFCDGSGFETKESLHNIHIYGYNLSQLLDIIHYAFQNGYRTNEMRQVNEVVGMS